MLVLPIHAWSVASQASAAWSPLSLFAASEQGVWYDPTDLARYMDVSASPELVTNGGFDSATGWTLTANATISGGILNVSAGSGVFENFATQSAASVTVNRWYQVTLSVTRSAGGLSFFIGAVNLNDRVIDNLTTSGTRTFTFLATANTNFIFRSENGFTGSIDNISVREVTAISTVTMYQDAAGTTPVTAVEQPVGLILDRRLGALGALGENLVTNGDFSGPTSYFTDSAFGGSANITSGQLHVTASGGTYSGVAAPILNYAPAGWYYVEATLVSGTGRFTLDFSDVEGVLTNTDRTGPYTYRGFVKLRDSDGYFRPVIRTATSGATSVWDNISFRRVLGNHAIQATSTARPTLRNRYNLLTFTEQFDNAVWSKDSCTILSNSAVSPDGKATADKVVSAAATAQTGVGSSVISPSAGVVTQSWSCKQAEVRYVQLLWNGGISSEYANFDLQTGVVTQTNAAIAPVVTTDDEGYWRLSLSVSAAAGSLTMFCWAISSPTAGRGAVYPGNGTAGFFVWGAQFTTAADASLPYQRVALATDYDSDPAKFPLRLNADGLDDAMALATLGTLNPTAGAFELFVAFRYVNVDTDSVSAWMNDAIFSDAGGWASPIYARSSGLVGASGGTNNGQKLEVAADIRARHVWHARLAGGQLTVSLDGGAEQSIACGNWGSTAGVMRLFQSLQGFAEVHLHELIFRDGSVSAGARASAISYLKTRWGVT
jgi:hypothetical protein